MLHLTQPRPCILRSPRYVVALRNYDRFPLMRDLRCHRCDKYMDSHAEQTIDIAAEVATKIALTAAQRDADRSFPTTEFELLDQAGLMTAFLPLNLGGQDLGGSAHRQTLYRVLAHIGRGSLPVGRLFEDHINALDLVMTSGSDTQRRHVAEDAHAHHIFGVWNTQTADGVTLHPTGKRVMLKGAKVFCSGAGHITRTFANGAWYSPDDPRAGGWQMVLVKLDTCQDRAVPDSWPAEGMRASLSGRFSFEDIEVDTDALIGNPGDYTREPDFTGGAVRFAAVQLGGAEALLNAAVTLLKQSNRTDDPHQRARIGRSAIAIESGYLWLLGVARLWATSADSDAIVTYARMARTAIERITDIN